MFLIILGILLLVSFLWAYVGLRKELKTHKRVEHAKRELHKEKILFKR